jgi:hypothetical protein
MTLHFTAPYDDVDRPDHPRALDCLTDYGLPRDPHLIKTVDRNGPLEPDGGVPYEIELTGFGRLIYDILVPLDAAGPSRGATTAHLEGLLPRTRESPTTRHDTSQRGPTT